jgi:hypothetical protein
MENIVHKAKNHKEAEAWDVTQQIMMSPEERQRIAGELKIRFYGKNSPDVRDEWKRKIRI